MLPFKIAAVVLCDDIRLEQNNKHILIGVYNGTIVIPNFPAVFPVCWWIQVFSTETGSFELDIQLVKDQGDTLLRARIGYEILTNDWASISLPRVQLQIQGPGKLKLQMKKKAESDWITIQDLEIKQGDVVGGPPIQHILA
jgi:hypothetical protein